MVAKIAKIFHFGNDVDIFLMVSGDMSMIILAVYCFLGERIENLLRVSETAVSLHQKKKITTGSPVITTKKKLLTKKILRYEKSIIYFSDDGHDDRS